MIMASGSLGQIGFFVKMKVFVVLLTCLTAVSPHRGPHVEHQENNAKGIVSSKSILLSCLRPGRQKTTVDNLAKDREPVQFMVSKPCERKTTAAFLDHTNEIRQYLAIASCQISDYNIEGIPNLIILHNEEEKEEEIITCGRPTDLNFRAMLLLQMPNMVTYTILDPTKGHWLFTNPLSGCDIFIATKQSQPDMPLVVHANADKLKKPEEQAENLRWKGIAVDQVLQAFISGYVLRARIYDVPMQPIPEGYAGYWTEYRNGHPDVTILTYDNANPIPQEILFFGQYKNAWSFFLKGKENGLITNVPI